MLDRPIQTLSVLLCIALVLAMLPAAYQGVLFAWHPMMLTVGFIGAFWMVWGPGAAQRIACIPASPATFLYHLPAPVPSKPTCLQAL